MSCDGSDSIAVIKTNAKRIKDGKMRRYKDKLFGEKWPECYAVLYQDSTFVWYDDESERTPRGSLQLKDYAPFLAVGVYSTRLPDRPTLPSGTKIDHVIAVGTGAMVKSKIYWFLCHGDDDLTAWMSQIVSTLPPPPPPPQQPSQPSSQMASNYNQGRPNQPPPAYGPPPNYGPPFAPVQAPGYYPPAAPDNPPSHTTVVVSAPSYPSYGSGGGFGTGMLAGGLIGYGLGSMSHWGTHGCGYGYGWGGGFGYGGGSHVDNDTTIVNNYNITNTNNDFNAYDQTDNYYDGGGGGGDFDYGGDTGGGDTFDAGGGGFSGGDGGY